MVVTGIGQGHFRLDGEEMASIEEELGQLFMMTWHNMIQSKIKVMGFDLKVIDQVSSYFLKELQKISSYFPKRLQQITSLFITADSGEDPRRSLYVRVISDTRISGPYGPKF